MPGALRPDAARVDPDRRQPLIGIVGAERKPVLGARGEHAIGLADTARDEVVDHDAHIAVGAPDDERLGAARGARRIQPGEQPLRRRFLIARRAVDLAGKIEAGQLQAFERGDSSRGSIWSYSMA